MDEGGDPNERLRASWSGNAAAWTEAVRGGGIRSRRGATDAAVLRAVTEVGPRTVLDVGCGEGWLSHALAERGREVVGIDGSEALIRVAREGPGTFHVVDYGRLAEDPATAPGPFDAIVCNFSLLGSDLTPLLAALRDRLAGDGRLIVQTLHPFTGAGGGAYRDGWREETFASFGGSFPEPMPWYFRTVGSWFTTLSAAGFRVVELREPVVEDDPLPASLLLVCERPSGEDGVED